MALFNNEEEQARKEKLRYLEDKRVAFAERCAGQGFKPDKMFFCSDEHGGFTALARDRKRHVVITAPVFGDPEGDYHMYVLDELRFDKEIVEIKGTGLNGMFGFGTKPAIGVNLRIELPEGEAVMELVGGRTTYMVVNRYKDNPLLKTRRRRSDANVVWDFMPIDAMKVEKLEKELDEYYLA